MLNKDDLKRINADSYEQLLHAVRGLQFDLATDDLAQLELISLASPYATDHVIRSPEIYLDWKKNVKANLSFDVSSLKTKSTEDVDAKQIKAQLRQIRHYYLCHIIFNDICVGLPVADILNQISDLAIKLIEIALDIATRIQEDLYGVPLNSKNEHQKLMIMAMGKLGGGELNFSSDIDLIFVYAQDGELDNSSKLSYREFFIRVGRLFTQLLNDTTVDGFVYRVDLRLRPWGDSGPLVINLAGLENYYQAQGRDWERYALVKAKIVTGYESDVNDLQSIIQPFVYRKYHDFNVFTGLGSLKQQIDKEARKKRQALNVKLCSGGIREIEFCMQALQILQGGRHPYLQETSILKMFELAKQETFYSEIELNILKKSYEYLRVVENRIQMMFDRQTHLLPTSDEYKSRLLSSLPYSDWQQLLDELSVVQLQVNLIFKQLFIEQVGQVNSKDFSSFDEEDWLSYCFELQFKEPSIIAKHLFLFFKERTILSMSSKGRERLNDLLPNFLILIRQQADVLNSLNLLTKLLLSIARRSVYLELLYMHHPLLQKLINLFAKSPLLAEELIQFPILLESVLLTENDYVFDKENLKKYLTLELQQVKGDVELELDTIRVFKRQQLFQIAIQELDEKIEPMVASEFLSDLASLVLQVSYELNLAVLIEQHGHPVYVLDGKQYTAAFGIVAYGKLGGKELHYTSDLDVIFVHDSCGTKQQTNGNKSIENSVFFMRLAQKITQTLSLLTSSGRVYEVDARLRPNGASGFLVSSLQAYKTYQSEKAWVWEHQALVRANFVAGDVLIKDKYQLIKCDILKSINNQVELKAEVEKMRLKMLSTNNKTEVFNLKKSKGGMIDVEFIVQYLVLIHANKLSSLCEYSANISLLKYLHQNNCISDEYLSLINIYKMWHKLLHQQVLQQAQEVVVDEQIKTNIETVNNLWSQCFNKE